MTLWSPTNLGTVPKIWLKANDLGLSNGATVSSWADSSGNGSNATVPGWGTAPTYETPAQFLTLGIVKSNASSLQALRATHSVTLPYTVFVMGRLLGLTNGRIISGFQDTGTNWLVGWWSAAEDQMYATGWVWQPPTSSTANYHIYSATGDGATAQFYNYGSLLASNSSGIGGLGGKLALSGSNENDSQELSDSNIGEVIICNSVLSTADRQLVEGYMAWKWGLQANLPVGHPFVGAAPNVMSASRRSSTRRS